jgi:hypothetical protein
MRGELSQHDQKTDILRPRYVLFRSTSRVSKDEVVKTDPERMKRKRRRKSHHSVHWITPRSKIDGVIEVSFFDIQKSMSKFGVGLKH